MKLAIAVLMFSSFGGAKHSNYVKYAGFVSGHGPAERFGDDMRVRHSKWSCLLLAAGLALSVSAAACGDDDDDDTGGGGAGAGAGGKSGSGGGGTGGTKAGSGGSSGGGAGSVSAAMCISDTNTATANMQPAACVECICEAAADRTAVETCNKTMNCWQLISCVGAMCPGLSGSDQTNCAVMKCGTFVGAGTQAMPVGAVLTGKCSSKCIGGEDGGGADAGN